MQTAVRLEPEPRKRHARKPATPFVSTVFLYAANPYRMRRQSNDSFETGRPNSADTLRFVPSAAGLT